MAQTTPTEILEPQLESIADGNEENETDLVQLAESIGQILDNPIKINFTDASGLERIPNLNDFQINNLLRYRKRSGMLYSLYELAQVEGFDQVTALDLAPYLDFSTQLEVPNLKLRNVLKYSRHEFIYRTDFDLEKRAGFTDGDFLGPQGNHYLRYRGTYRDNITIGLVGQQDAGEPFGGQQRLGIDFISGHVALSNYGKVKELIIGDYQLEFGQGLAAWTGLAFGKGAQTTQIKRYARGVRGYAGAEENRFMRGAASKIRLGNFDVTTFYSNNSIDANEVESDTFLLEEVPAVSSLQTTGLHRTANEFADKDANRLITYGGNVNYRGQGFSVGATAIQNILEKPLNSGEQLYQKFRLRGERFTNYALDFNRLWRNFNLFGEIAINDSLKHALSIGLETKLADNLTLSMLYRNFDTKYTTVYNAPFAENGGSGERGFYAGIDWEVYGRIKIKAYADHYYFDWLRFGVGAPSKGRDYLLQWEHPFSRYFSYYLRYRNETQQTNADAVQTPLLQDRRRESARLHIAYSANANWQLANRVEYTFFTSPEKNERGFMVFQDVKYTFSRLPLKLIGRVALTETPSFDTRIYAYENDVLYAFSIPPYYGQSTRFYLMGSYAFADGITLQLRYGFFRFFDRNVISSGTGAIAGNFQSEIKVSLRVKL